MVRYANRDQAMRMNSISALARPPSAPLPITLTLTLTLHSSRVVHSGPYHGIRAAIPSTPLPPVALGSCKKLSVSISAPQSQNLKVPPRPSKSRGVPAASLGLTIRARPRAVMCVVLPALLAGALSHTTFSELGNLLFLPIIIPMSMTNPA